MHPCQSNCLLRVTIKSQSNIYYTLSISYRRILYRVQKEDVGKLCLYIDFTEELNLGEPSTS